MSIFNTKTDIIKTQINNLIYELRNTEPKSDQGIEYLEEKYKYLVDTSESLFKMIIKDSLKPDFNYTLFMKKIHTMLDYILQIQESKITQDKASEKIGCLLGKEYIPKELYKNNDYKELYE